MSEKQQAHSTTALESYPQITQLPDSEISELKARVKELESRPELYPMNLYNLDSSKYRLKYPVAIVVEEWPKNEFIAHWHDVEAIGFGEDREMAIESLKQDIIELYEDLMNAEDETLGKLPMKAKKILRDIIEVDS